MAREGTGAGSTDRHGFGAGSVHRSAHCEAGALSSYVVPALAPDGASDADDATGADGTGGSPGGPSTTAASGSSPPTTVRGS